MKKNSDQIVEAISAEDIGKLPDTTIAESLARLPGVTTQRDKNGNATNVSIRGLGPDFNGYLLNGREQTSTGDSRADRPERLPGRTDRRRHRLQDRRRQPDDGRPGRHHRQQADRPAVRSRSRVLAVIGEKTETGRGLPAARPRQPLRADLHRPVRRPQDRHRARLRARVRPHQPGRRGQLGRRDAQRHHDRRLGVHQRQPAGLRQRPERAEHARARRPRRLGRRVRVQAERELHQRDRSLSRQDHHQHEERVPEDRPERAAHHRTRRSPTTRSRRARSISRRTRTSRSSTTRKTSPTTTRCSRSAGATRSSWPTPGRSWPTTATTRPSASSATSRSTAASSGNDTLSFTTPNGFGVPQLTVGNPSAYTTPGSIVIRDQTGWAGLTPPQAQDGYLKGPTTVDKINAMRLDFTHDLQGGAFSDVQFGANITQRTKDRHTDEGLVNSAADGGFATLQYPAGSYVEDNVGGTGINLLTFDPTAGPVPRRDAAAQVQQRHPVQDLERQGERQHGLRQARHRHRGRQDPGARQRRPAVRLHGPGLRRLPGQHRLGRGARPTRPPR